MREVMLELDPIEIFSAKGKYRVYDLSELNDANDVLVVQMNTDDSNEIDDMGDELSEIMNRPVIIIAKGIKFFRLKKITWFDRLKLSIKKFLKNSETHSGDRI